MSQEAGEKEKEKDQPKPQAEPRWVQGAEPLAICMSCNATFPMELTHCPKCRVGLSVVRKCPSCERIQSVQHRVCIYCANSFMQESGLGRLAEEAPSRRRGLAPGAYLVIASGLAVAVTIGVFLHHQAKVLLAPAPVIGHSYALEGAAMRRDPAMDSPEIKDLQPSEVVGITGFETDEAGHRWFQIRDDGINGFALAEEMAPPKADDVENGYALLRHSLLGMNDPSVLPEATKALAYYQAKFPASRHRDELDWLLAEKIRTLAPKSSRQQELLDSARKIYERLAAGDSSLSGSARQALENYPTATAVRPSKEVGRERDPFGLRIVGQGSLSSAPSASGVVRRLTVVSRTPLVVVLREAVAVSPGTFFEGEIDRDVRVHNEVAVPRGSLVHLGVAEISPASSAVRVSPTFIRLSDVVIAGRPFGVSAVAIRIDPPPGHGISSAPGEPPRLPAGTRISFQLTEPLMVPQG